MPRDKLPHEPFIPDFFTPPDNNQCFHIIFLWYKKDDKADDFIWGKYCFVYYVLWRIRIKYPGGSDSSLVLPVAFVPFYQ